MNRTKSLYEQFYIMEALLEAINQKSETLVSQLLQSGVDPTLDNNKALLYAIGARDCENIINLLLRYGAKANQRMFESAVLNYDENIVEKLLEHGADAKKLGDYNQNALHKVCNVYKDTTSKVCELLIKKGADVNQQSQICRITPLWNAIDKGNNSVIEVLLQYGAKPCLEMDAPMGIGVPLEYCFSLKAPTIESLIKYAALQVDISDERAVEKFFQFIANARNRDGGRVPNIGRKYAKLARDSFGEINILKEKILNEDKVSLFDFVVSQRDILESYRSDSNIVNSVLDHIISTPLPVYREVILKKLGRNMIIHKITTTRQWCYVSEGRENIVNPDCIELIAAYLSVIDLVNLLIALVTVS